MKNQANSKEVHKKHTIKEQPRTATTGQLSNLIKKMSHTIKVSIQTKSIILNSHRGSKPLVQSLKTPLQTGNHSRKHSMGSTNVAMMSCRSHLNKQTRESKQLKSKRQREHNRSNSTVSKKSNKEMKNCFKIDLSKLQAKEQIISNINFQSKQVNRQNFDCQYVIGKGGFGKVWSVKLKKTQTIYAMKQMHKTKIIGKKSIHSVLNERQLLSKLKHPFIVNMAYAFQDRQNLYLIMDLLVGGDLRYHMGCRRRFKQSQAKFFIACILIGLEFLHLNNIIHRDIKPENIVFDDRGYLRITDLGIARQVKPNNSADTSGTPGYMAPEVMCRQDHSFPVDYYAVGVIAYELMLGKRPYYGRNRKEIRDQILSKQVQIKAQEIPPGWSIQAADFINRMIQRKPAQRLGTQNGITQIKDHPWLKNFTWTAMLKKNMPSPFIPINVLNSKDYKDQISSSSEQEGEDENRLLLRKKSVEQLFQGYSYYCKQGLKKQVGKQKPRKMSMKANTTANTHNSYQDEKQSHRGKVKANNYLKPY